MDGALASEQSQTVTVSVVSHGHDRYLSGLLTQIAGTGPSVIAHVILVHNLPPTIALDVPSGAWPFRLTEIVNQRPVGFGANHNRSFALATTPYFCVLNPDITLPDPTVWSELLTPAGQRGVGCAFPVLLNPDGSQQDNGRALPTPLALVRRRILQRHDLRVDWASAAFWMLPANVFRRLGGFDERYHMYCEDVDFCLRMQLAGFRLVRAQGAVAVHDAQRRSHGAPSHLGWHLKSLLRLWSGAPLRRFLMSGRS